VVVKDLAGVVDTLNYSRVICQVIFLHDVSGFVQVSLDHVADHSPWIGPQIRQVYHSSTTDAKQRYSNPLRHDCWSDCLFSTNETVLNSVGLLYKAGKFTRTKDKQIGLFDTLRYD